MRRSRAVTRSGRPRPAAAHRGPERSWSQGINASSVSIGFDPVGRVSDGTVVGQGAPAPRGAVGRGCTGVAYASGDPPVPVGDPAGDQRVAAATEARAATLTAAALAGRARG